MDITVSINPEFELRLASVSVQERVPAAADFDGNQFEIGHARFSIFGEVGEIMTGVLLLVEYTGEDGVWRLVVVPRPALEPLAEVMGKLVMAESGEAIRKQVLVSGCSPGSRAPDAS